MTPGERFDQDEVLRFGDPWHGLYRNGVIELPNATTRAPGSSPSSGSSFAIQIPGQPAATTPTEDAAQGMTWLNYAIMTGDDHAVYGRPMGNNAWIYIDADGVPWRAVLTGSSGTMTITLHRFGLFDTAEETYSDSISFVWISGQDMKVDDVDSTGRNAALVFRDASNNNVQRVFLLTLSGPGATFTVVVEDETPDPLVSVDAYSFPDSIWGAGWHRTDELDITGPYPFDNYGNLVGAPSGGSVSKALPLMAHYSSTTTTIVGASLVGDTFALVTFTTYAETLSVTTVDMGNLFNIDYYYGPLGAYFPPYHRVTTVTGFERISLAGFDTEVSNEWSGEEWKWPPFDDSETDETYHWVDSTYVTHVVSPIEIDGHVEPAPLSQWSSGGSFSNGDLRGVRVANRAYGLDVSGGPGSGTRFFVCGPADNGFSISPDTGSAISNATTHPISGDFVTGSTTVCWV